MFESIEESPRESRVFWAYKSDLVTEIFSDKGDHSIVHGQKVLEYLISFGLEEEDQTCFNRLVEAMQRISAQNKGGESYCLYELSEAVWDYILESRIASARIALEKAIGERNRFDSQRDSGMLWFPGEEGA